MGTSLLRAGAIYTLANVLSAGVPFLLLPILTRALPPDQYGEVVAFFLLVSIAASVAGLNVHGSVAVRWFERDGIDFPAYVGSAVTLALASTLLCVLLLVGAAALWHDHLALPAWMWPLAAVTAGATTLANVRTTLWQSQRLPWSAAMYQVGNATLNLGLSLAAVLLVGLGAAGRNGAACVTASLAALVGVLLLRRSQDLRWAVDARSLRQLMRFGLPLVPHALAGATIATADRYVVSSQLGPDALGIYGTAAQLGMALNVLSDAVVKAATPWLYAQLSQSGARGRLRVVAATYASIPTALAAACLIWLAFVALGPWILGPRYQAAIGLSLWFLLGGALTAIYLNIASLFFFTARSEWLAAATVVSALTAVLAAPSLTAAYGVEGAAASYCLVQGVQTLLSWLLSLRIQPMPWQRAGLAMRSLMRPRVTA
jgi:O-antigen/teichoic acid export membrane protein